MKLLVFFTYGVSLKSWFECGILSREIEIYRELNKRGIEISFFTYGDSSDLQIAQNIDFTIDVYPLYNYKKINNSKIIDVISTLILISKNRKYFNTFTIFKSNQFWGSWLPLFCKIIFDKKFILRCGFEINKFAKYSRGNLFIVMTYLLSQIIYRMADKIFVTSEDDRIYIIKNFLQKTNINKIINIPNLINTKKFKPSNMSPKRDILVIARLEKQKNIELAIMIASKLNLSLTLIGRGSLKGSICDYADSALNDFIYHESIDNDEIPSIFGDHKFYLTASHYEGNPKSLLEAMSSGCLVFARNSPGISNIIKNKVNGFLFNDYSDLYSLMSNIIKDSKSNFNWLKINSREYVKKHHDIDVITDVELNSYHQLMANK